MEMGYIALVVGFRLFCGKSQFIISVIISVIGIIDVVREVSVLADLWVVRLVVWGLMPSLAGARHAYVLGVGWASTLVMMVVMVLSS